MLVSYDSSARNAVEGHLTCVLQPPFKLAYLCTSYGALGQMLPQWWTVLVPFFLVLVALIHNLVLVGVILACCCKLVWSLENPIGNCSTAYMDAMCCFINN